MAEMAQASNKVSMQGPPQFTNLRNGRGSLTLFSALLQGQYAQGIFSFNAFIKYVPRDGKREFKFWLCDGGHVPSL